MCMYRYINTAGALGLITFCSFKFEQDKLTEMSIELYVLYIRTYISTLFASLHLVSITMILIFASQITCQKSATDLWSGPVMELHDMIVAKY